MRQQLLILISITVLFVLGLASFALRINLREIPPTPKVIVTIPEGSTVSEINRILLKSGVLKNASLPTTLEGYLFPDTYEFFLDSSEEIVERKFRENFDSKIESLFLDGVSEEKLKEAIITASLIEMEVPSPEDRRIVSGIIETRLVAGIPLQIDASICYVKGDPCLPITDSDKKIDSLYNTHLYRGLPPGPIGNPGLDAIDASINPRESPYLYYISDPETGGTIFAASLDEHNSNVVKYLGR